MGKVTTRLRGLRLEYRTMRNSPVTIQEVAEATGILRKRLTNLELGQFDRITTDEIERLCTYYTKALERPVSVSDLLEFDPNKLMALRSVAV